MSQHFEKQVQIEKTDNERQVAIGAVMVPSSVDSQGDFERADTINALSEDYMERLARGESKAGLMHVKFPGSKTLAPVENRVLSSPGKIGDEEYPAGTWQVGVKVRDDALWSLITESKTLTGFSIGGQVHDVKTHAVDDLPDGVSIDDDLRTAAKENDVPIREITDATIHEISLVDHPAVERAQIQTAKGDGDLAKASDALTDSVESAMEHLVEERGHEPEPARELAEFLNREKSAGGDSWLTRAKEFFSGDSSTGEEKTGRTLSGRNIDSARAVHDAALDMLGRSDVDHGRIRFSDDPTTDFDVGGYGAQKAQQSDELAESSAGSNNSVETMDKDELRDLIGDVVDEKMADEEAQTEEKSDDESDDLEEIKAQLSELQESLSDDSEEEEKADEDDELAEIKEMLGEIASAQGVSQQADNGQRASEKTWDSSPFAAGGGR